MKILKTIPFLVIIMISITSNIGAMGQQSSGFDENINEEKFYNMDDIKNLDIAVSSADVRISVVNSDKLRVHLHGSSSSQKPYLTDKKVNSRLSIKVDRKSSFGISRSNLILEIELPGKYKQNLEIRSSSGDISVSNIELNIFKVDLSSGDLNLQTLNVRDFYYDSSSGKLRAVNIESQETELEASSGSIIIDKFSGNIKAKLSSGNIKFAYSNFKNSISINNSSGDITISLPDKSNFELNAKTSSGKITCDFPITISGEQNRDELKGIVGTGENTITIKVSSGDISILKN
ncbi:MAG: DUF4097 family beta strand repeat protein [Spirochaetales bacterium]|nr:DUF4097 family beta strand repeat protein [Spirochaetales bacterium]